MNKPVIDTALTGEKIEISNMLEDTIAGAVASEAVRVASAASADIGPAERELASDLPPEEGRDSNRSLEAFLAAERDAYVAAALDSKAPALPSVAEHRPVEGTVANSAEVSQPRHGHAYLASSPRIVEPSLPPASRSAAAAHDDARGAKVINPEVDVREKAKGNAAAPVASSEIERAAARDGGPALNAAYWQQGTEGNDAIVASDTARPGYSNYIVHGLGGHDHITSGRLGDELYGDNGNDTLVGGRGADSFDGGDGFDWIDYSGSSEGVWANLGIYYWNDLNGFIDPGVIRGANTLEKDWVMNIGTLEAIKGSNHSDRIEGTGRATSYEFWGWLGNDILGGGSLSDTLDGGLGGDNVSGDSGDDWVYGYRTADGNYASDGARDDLEGNDGNDTIYGGSEDYLTGGKGNDVLIGGHVIYDDTDSVSVSLYNNLAYHGAQYAYRDELYDVFWVKTGAGADQIISNTKGTEVYAGAGADVIYGGLGNDKLYGEQGMDRFYGSGGSDLIEGGGWGADSGTVDYSGFTGSVNVNLLLHGEGDGTADKGGGQTDRLKNIINVFGSQAGDVLIGNNNSGASGDYLNGHWGDDVIHGRNGEDELHGSSGNDRLFGDDGADKLYGGASIDTANDDDTLDGGAGADTMEGGLGNDHYYIDTDQDVIVELDGSNGGIDTVHTFNDFTLGVQGTNVENIVGEGGGNISLHGTYSSNHIWGNSGNNTLTGGGGNDILDSGSGADKLEGGFDTDQLFGRAGIDTLDGGAGADIMDGGLDNDIYYIDNLNDVAAEVVEGGTADLAVITAFNYDYDKLAAGNIELYREDNGGRVNRRPVVSGLSAQPVVSEEIITSGVLASVYATDDGRGGTLKYKLTNDFNGAFQVNQEGKIFQVKKIDYDADPNLFVVNGGFANEKKYANLTLVAYEEGEQGALESKPYSFQFEVRNTNEAATVTFSQQASDVRAGSTGRGVHVITATAHDQDAGHTGFGRNYFRFADTKLLVDGTGFFTIDRETGKITVNQDIPKTAPSLVVLRVEAYDDDTNTIVSQEVTYNLTILPRENKPPAPPLLAGDTDKADIAENTAYKVTLKAIDQDNETPPSGMRYAFDTTKPGGGDANGAFKIDGDELQLDGTFNFETLTETFVKLWIVAIDHENGVSEAREITINIKDINEAPYSLAVQASGGDLIENSTARVMIRDVVAFDDDTRATSKLEYRFDGRLTSDTDASGKFQIDVGTGEIYLVADAKIDFEGPGVKHDQTGHYLILDVVAFDEGGLASNVLPVRINVVDTNEAVTSIEYKDQVAVIADTTKKDAFVARAAAQDPDIYTPAFNNNKYRFANGTGFSDDGLFTIDPDGNIRARRDIREGDEGIKTYEIEVYDAGNTNLKKTFTYTVTIAEPLNAEPQIKVEQNGKVEFDTEDTTPVAPFQYLILTDTDTDPVNGKVRVEIGFDQDLGTLGNFIQTGATYVNDPDNGSLIVEGTLAQVQAFIRAVMYDPDDRHVSNPAVKTEFHVELFDYGSPYARQDSIIVTVNAEPGNKKPAFDVLDDKTEFTAIFNGDPVKPFVGVRLDDTEGNDLFLTITFANDQGSLSSLDWPGVTLEFNDVLTDGTKKIVLKGSAAALEALLATVTFDPNEAFSSSAFATRFSFAVRDDYHDDETFANEIVINARAATDPTIKASGTGPETVEDIGLAPVFAHLSVNDDEDSLSGAEMTLTIRFIRSHGALEGATADSVTNDGNDVVYTFKGTKDELNDILLDLKFNPFDRPVPEGSPAENTQFTVIVTDSDGRPSAPTVVDIDATVTNRKPHDITLTGDAVREDWGWGVEAGILSATDSNNDTLTFSVTDARFRVEKNAADKWVLVLNGPLDYESATPDNVLDPSGKTKYYAVDVTVSDGHGGTTTESVRVYVEDDGFNPDNAPPVITGAQDSHVRDIDLATPFTTLNFFDAEDMVSPNKIMTFKATYSLEDVTFIRPSLPEGVILSEDYLPNGIRTVRLEGTLQKILDVARELKFNPNDRPTEKGVVVPAQFDIELVDSNGGRTGTKVVVHVEAADQAPTVITLSENEVREDEGVGTVAGVLGAEDPNGDTEFTFQLANPNDSRFYIEKDPADGKWKIFLKGPLDYETASKEDPTDPNGDVRYYDVLVVASDGGGSVTKPVRVYVLNDDRDPENAAPEFQVMSDPTLSIQDNHSYNLFAHLKVADSDSSATDLLTLKITFEKGHGVLEGWTPDPLLEKPTTVTYVFANKTLGELDIILRDLLFNPDNKENAPHGWTRDTHFRLSIEDHDGGSSGYDLDVEVTANRAPHSLEFEGQPVSEDQGQNTVAGELSAFDPNGDPLTFSVDPSNEYFTTIQENGVWKLVLKKALDFDGGVPDGDLRYYEVTVTVSDGGPNGSIDMPVRVYVTESDNTPPSIDVTGTPPEKIYDIDEAKVFAHLSLGDAEDGASGAEMTLTITFQKGKGEFKGESAEPADPSATIVTYKFTGTLADLETKLQNLEFQPADRPTEMGAIDVTNFNVHIKDSDNGSTNLPVAVQVEAANQAPVDIVLDGDPVREDWGRGTVAGILEAQDPNGETDFEFALASASEQRFEIVQRNGQWVLVLKQALDYDNATSDTPNGPRYHTVEIKVTDGGDLSYTETVKVYVTDDGIVPENAVPEIKVIGEPVTTAQDDTIPTVFAHLAVNDVEDSQSTTDKMTLKITFARGHGALEGRTPDDFSETDTHVTYTYTDLMVNLNQLLRQLKFNPDDYENAPSGWTRDTHFQVTIIDSEGGSTSTDVDVEVTANRQPEQIVFDGDEVSESEGQNTRVGTLQATDPNGDTLTFSTADDDPFFDTVFEDGVWKLILKQRLEYDTATIDWVNDPTGMTRYYEAYVTVSDGGPNGSREEVILVYVTESDNEPPTITPNGDGLGQIEDIAEGKVFAHLTLGDTEDEISDEDMTLEITFELGRGDLVGIDPVLKTSSATHVTYVYKGSLAFLNNLLLNVLKFAPDDRPTEKGEVETTNFSVMIIDSDNGTAQVDVVLDVVAANQGPKDFTLTGFRADGAVEVEENQYGGETVLFQIGELEAVDPNGDELIYVFSSDADSNPHGFFRIDDDRLVLASGVFLDYDANDPLLKGVLGGERWYEVKIKVTDGEEEVEKTFQVFVKDDPTDQPNVAPKLEIQGTKEWPPIKDIETIQPFAGVTIEDSATQILTITITLSGNTGEFTDDSIPDNLQLSYENGVLRLRGSAVDLTNTLQNLVFDPKDRANAEVGEEETTTFTITVTDGNLTTSNSEIKVVAEAANRAPTAITLSGNGIQENCVIGEVVGILGAADTNDGDTFTYELETDAGGRFKIVQQGNDWVIVTLKGIDFDNDSDLQSGDVNGVPRKWFNVDVRVTDQGGTGESIVRPVQIFVNDEAPDTQYDPTGATLSDHSIMENVDPGTAVGTLDGIDRNGGDTFTFAVVDNSATDPLSAHTLFDVSADGKLITKGEIDWDAVDGLLQVETDASGNITRKYYVVYVEVRDQANTATPAYVQRFEIDVEEDPNEGGNTAPENIRLSEQFVAENLSVGAAVGSILADDANGDTLTFELIENGGGAFDLIGDTIFVKDHTKLDYEQYATGEISLTVGVSDGTETVTHVINLGLEKFSRESVTGNADANLMRGGGGNDEFRGGLGNDTLSGGSGQDALVGGGGSDVFLFDSPLARTNIDLIADFNRSDGDQIRLAKTIFANLSGTGVLQEDEFVVDTEARTANHHIIYDRQSGKLYYDLDGVGGRAAIQFASFRVTQTVPAPEVKFSDFFIL